MKPKVIFVGAFRDSARDGSAGGQLYACRTLLDTPLSQAVEWVLIDSTMESLPPPSLRRRLWKAVKRIVAFTLKISSADAVLIFSSARMSLIEKGMMAVIGSLWRKRVVFSPRSGLIIDDVENSRFMRWFLIQIMRRVNKIVCQSESWRQYYRRVTKLPEDRFVVIYNWMNIEPYHNIFDCRQENKGNGGVIFLYLGWLERYKGIFDLINAVSLKKDELPQAYFVICGAGSVRREAEELVKYKKLTDKFVFRGWVSGKEKEEMLCSADVLVLPSHREGLPNALLEAMASGLAVVATKVGAIPEVVQDGVSGILVDAASPDELGQALVALASDQKKRLLLAKNGRRRVTKFHDVDHSWPLVLDLLVGSD